MKTHKEIMTPENLEQLRRDVMQIMLENDETIAGLAKKIGINHISLRKFTSEKGETQLLTVIKIDDYINACKGN